MRKILYVIIDNLSAGIRHPLRLLQGPDHAILSPTDSPPSRHLSGGRLQLESCPRHQLESVAALRWNTHQIRLFGNLFGNQSQDPVRVLFQWRNTPAAPFRRRASCLTPALAPSNYRTNAHLEDLAISRRDAPLSTASTARSRKSVEYGLGNRFSSPGESAFPVGIESRDFPTAVA